VLLRVFLMYHSHPLRELTSFPESKNFSDYPIDTEVCYPAKIQKARFEVGPPIGMTDTLRALPYMGSVIYWCAQVNNLSRREGGRSTWARFYSSSWIIFDVYAAILWLTRFPCGSWNFSFWA
jgi:hypothetical protein